MLRFEKTSLWRNSLGKPHRHDEHQEARERLRNAYMQLRGRAADLAKQIERDLPEFTVHDVSHLDALWELADLIAGPKFTITPAEGFVIGAAFLIHDLGLALAAYPEGSIPFLVEIPRDRLRVIIYATALLLRFDDDCNAARRRGR